MLLLPVPVATPSNVWVCGRLIAGTAGSNPSYLLSVLCIVRQRSLSLAEHSFRGILPTEVEVCLNVLVKP